MLQADSSLYGGGALIETSITNIQEAIEANIVRGRLTRNKLVEARNKLLTNNTHTINENELLCLHSHEQLAALLKDNKLATSDYVDNTEKLISSD